MFVLPLKWNIIWFMYAFKSSQFSIEVHWRIFRYSTFLKWRGKPAKFCACQIILASQWICGFLWWIINITIELDSLASFEQKLMVKRVPRTLHVLIYALNSFQNKKEKLTTRSVINYWTAIWRWYVNKKNVQNLEYQNDEFEHVLSLQLSCIFKTTSFNCETTKSKKS